MKFSCDREKLQKNLNIAQRATDPKSNIAILRNVLFDVASGKLNLVGFDHRMGIRTVIECNAEEEGKITVPCALLLEVLGVMREETVYFSLDGYVMTVECGKSNYKLNCLSADDFPEFPEIGEEKSFDIGTETLDNGVRQTLLATNPEDPRAFMGGVFMKADNSSIIFVGTDGHRLAFRRFDLGDVKAPEFEIIVPSRTFGELMRIMSDSESDTVKIGLGEKSVSITLDSVYIVSRLVDAKYPKYEKVIPEVQGGSCRVARDKMVAAVRGAAIMARAKENKDMIEINITEESMKFSASTQDVGSADEEIEITKKGNDIRFAFNSRYILDFLNVVNTDEIVVEYTEELNPSLFHTDNPDYKYVLMPIKV